MLKTYSFCKRKALCSWCSHKNILRKCKEPGQRRPKTATIGAVFDPFAPWWARDWPLSIGQIFLRHRSPILHSTTQSNMQATIQKWRRSIFAILAASWCWWRMQTSINGQDPAALQVCGPLKPDRLALRLSSTARTSYWSLRRQHRLALLHLHCPSRPRHYHRCYAAAGTGYADMLSSRRTLLAQPAGWEPRPRVTIHRRWRQNTIVNSTEDNW